MNIVVLAGGLSPERNVSLVSGQSICEALRSKGHRAVVLDMFFGLEGSAVGPEEIFDAPGALRGAESVQAEAPDLEAVRAARADQTRSVFGPGVLEACKAADMVFLGLHGECGEDGRVQAAFDLLGIPYTGAGHLGSAMAMNKAVAKRMMEQAGILTAPWRELVYTAADITRLTGELPLPCAVKTVNGGSSLGMALPETREELEAALRELLGYGGHVIVEKKIKGRDLTVGVLGDRYLPAVEMIPQPGAYFDYEAKYQEGRSLEVCPAEIDREIAHEMGEAALKLHQILGLRVYSRTDFILDEEGQAWCLEINTLPGMTPGSLLPKEAAAIGMAFPDLCEEILNLSLKSET